MESVQDTSDFDLSELQFNESVLRDLEENPFGSGTQQLRKEQKYSGFDNNSGDCWIYPTNLEIRQYQFNITQQCLFKNTLVILPTGLGKTFIAATVMYNFYRWYPKGKIIFMAPTKPLVNQQMEGIYRQLLEVIKTH